VRRARVLELVLCAEIRSQRDPIRSAWHDKPMGDG
jgi:hypothetical protein